MALTWSLVLEDFFKRILSDRLLHSNSSLKVRNLKEKKKSWSKQIWTVWNHVRCILTLDSSSSACSSPSLPALGLPSASCTTCWQCDSQKNTYKILNYAWIICSVRCLNPLLACIQFYNCTTVLCGWSLSFLFQSERIFKEPPLRNKLIKLTFPSCQTVLLNCGIFFSPPGFYLWLFNSYRSSCKTAFRIWQLRKYLWTEKCQGGGNSQQWSGPHTQEVSIWFNCFIL